MISSPVASSARFFVRARRTPTTAPAPAVPVFRLDGIKVFEKLDDAARPGQALVRTHVTETGEPLPEGYQGAWTGFNPDDFVYEGSTRLDCREWKSTDEGYVGSVGTGLHPDRWHYTKSFGACTNKNRLYCVEQ